MKSPKRIRRQLLTWIDRKLDKLNADREIAKIETQARKIKKQKRV